MVSTLITSVRSIPMLNSALEKKIQLKWSAPLCLEHLKTLRAKHHFHIRKNTIFNFLTLTVPSREGF